jgi:hypothetical protein
MTMATKGHLLIPNSDGIIRRNLFFVPLRFLFIAYAKPSRLKRCQLMEIGNPVLLSCSLRRRCFFFRGETNILNLAT